MIEEAPLGTHTHPIELFMKDRGWEFDGSFHNNDLCFEFPASFRGARDRIHFFTLTELGLYTLDCRFVVARQRLRAEILTCGVIDGCPAHASTQFKFLTGPGRSLARLLRTLENHASQLDPAEAVSCALFGACGESRSQENNPL